MIRRGLAVTLCTCAVATTVVYGARPAAAAPVSDAAHNIAGAITASRADAGSSQWSLAGSNSIDIGYDGTSLVYTVTFTQTGGDLSGTLDDPYYPTSGSLSGSVSGDSVTFTFSYPAGSVQGTRTYTGTISGSGAVSGSWTQTGSESPDNGTWSLASNAVLESSSPPTQACNAATAAYQAAQRNLDNLLGDLRNAQNSQADAASKVSDLTQQVDADKALIAQVKSLLSEGQDDNAILSQDLAGLTHTIDQVVRLPLGAVADAAVEAIRVVLLNNLDPEVEGLNAELADTFFQRAAVLVGEDAPLASQIIDLISANLVGALSLPVYTAVAFEAGKIGTAEIALEAVLVQLGPLQDQYTAASSRIGGLEAGLDVAQFVLDSDNADVSRLTSQVDAAQAAAQAALTAMTNACQAG
jgi:hypothetical protein